MIKLHDTLEVNMNDRIRELYYECQDESQSTEQCYQKFAELIVRECMRMCEVTEMSFVTHDCDVEASGAITVKQFIAEHFGVEE